MLFIISEKYQILDKVVTLAKRDKVVMGVMEKIHLRQDSITVKKLLQANQFAENSTSVSE